MTSGGAIKIFSSHRWAYNNHREGLHGLLSPTWIKNVDFVDHSIPKAHPVKVEDDLELAREIRNRIRQSDVLLVFTGMYVNFSDWVKFEIHSAFNDDCPIIAVIPNGQLRSAGTATKFADREVHWRGDSIRNAIWELLPDARKAEIVRARTARATRPQNALGAGLQLPPPRPFTPVAGLAPPTAPRLGDSAGTNTNYLADLLLDLYRKK